MSETFKIKEKCPKCGGVMETHILSRGCEIWCTECGYSTAGDHLKARELVFDKIFGKQCKTIRKTGYKVVFR